MNYYLPEQVMTQGDFAFLGDSSDTACSEILALDLTDQGYRSTRSTRWK